MPQKLKGSSLSAKKTGQPSDQGTDVTGKT